MKVALVDVDGHHYPNFALMRISAWHKMRGDEVEWYQPMFSNPDLIYASKIFTFTADFTEYAPWDPIPIRGGTGYDVKSSLPDEIDRLLPDYSIYSEIPYAVGFLSRGCIRHCSWCVVPEKEGTIRQYDDIERIAQGRRRVVLMDNNFLANDREFVKEQLEKACALRLGIDFNQGLDARLVTEENARQMTCCHWRIASGTSSYIRFSCDTQQMLGPCKNAIRLLREAGYSGRIFFYFLAVDPEETVERIEELLSFDNRIDPFVMPYRDLNGDGRVLNPRLNDLARWCNMASIRKSCSFKEYQSKGMKGHESASSVRESNLL